MLSSTSGFGQGPWLKLRVPWAPRGSPPAKVWVFACICVLCLCRPGWLRADLIDRYLQREMELNRLPGVVVALVRQRAVDVRAYGLANVATGQPLTSETLMELASVSKTFTGLAFLKLVKAGLIDPARPLADYLPEVARAADSRWSRVRVRHLLQHRSGLRRQHDFRVPCCGMPGDGDLGLAVERLLDVRLASHPGEVYQYANSNYVLLAALLERVTGRRFSEWMRETVFTPLGLNRTVIDRSLAGPMAAFHEWQWGRVRPSRSRFEGWYGASGVKSTGIDMARFLAGLMPGESLSMPNWWKQLEPPYDYGWHVEHSRSWPAAGLLLHHTGSLWGANTAILMAPEWQAGVAVLIPVGTDRAWPIAQNLLAATLGLPTREPRRTPRSQIPDTWAGVLVGVAAAFYAANIRWLVEIWRGGPGGWLWSRNLLQWIRAAGLWTCAGYVVYALYGGLAPPVQALPATVGIALPQLAWSTSLLLSMAGLRGVLVKKRRLEKAGCGLGG